MRVSRGVSMLTEEQVAQFEEAIRSEPDMERRAFLASELRRLRSPPPATDPCPPGGIVVPEHLRPAVEALCSGEIDVIRMDPERFAAWRDALVRHILGENAE